MKYAYLMSVCEEVIVTEVALLSLVELHTQEPCHHIWALILEQFVSEAVWVSPSLSIMDCIDFIHRFSASHSFHMHWKLAIKLPWKYIQFCLYPCQLLTLLRQNILNYLMINGYLNCTNVPFWLLIMSKSPAVRIHWYYNKVTDNQLFGHYISLW